MKKIIRNMLAVLFFAALFCLSGCSDSDESNGAALEPGYMAEVIK